MRILILLLIAIVGFLGGVIMVFVLSFATFKIWESLWEFVHWWYEFNRKDGLNYRRWPWQARRWWGDKDVRPGGAVMPFVYMDDLWPKFLVSKRDRAEVRYRGIEKPGLPSAADLDALAAEEAIK